MKRWIDLHRVDRYVLLSSQHDTDLEDRVRERMLEETTVVSVFGRSGGEHDTNTNKGSQSWQLSTPLVPPVAGL